MFAVVHLLIKLNTWRRVYDGVATTRTFLRLRCSRRCYQCYWLLCDY